MASFRRLAKDHAVLRSSPPPNYLFPSDDPDSIPDDLTQLDILVTGAEGTPYSKGLWRLHLKIPNDYPKSPPKATFRTRIYHPNVEETTGAVCLETLKRDWDPKLTLKDILVTISCLLIQPNPDSALNASAGALIQEDYDAFAKQAGLMTSIHAPIPSKLLEAVKDAKKRGEDSEGPSQPSQLSIPRSSQQDDPAEKENNTLPQNPPPRKALTGKRPLAELPLPDCDEEQKVTNGNSRSQPVRKSPKITHPAQLESTDVSLKSPPQGEPVSANLENIPVLKPRAVSASASLSGRAPLRKVSNLGSNRGMPRVGIRRL